MSNTHPNQIIAREEIEVAEDSGPSRDEESKPDLHELQPQNLRRSERQTTRLKYLDDYILLVEELGEEVLMYLNMYLNNEPRNFDEAKESREWTRTCEEEIYSIMKNKTWILVDDLSFGAKTIGLKWFF